MPPLYLPGFVINGPDSALSATAGEAVTFRTLIGFCEVAHPVAFRRADIKKTGLRRETRRWPVRRRTRPCQYAIDGSFFGLGIGWPLASTPSDQFTYSTSGLVTRFLPPGPCQTMRRRSGSELRSRFRRRSRGRHDPAASGEHAQIRPAPVRNANFNNAVILPLSTGGRERIQGNSKPLRLSTLVKACVRVPLFTWNGSRLIS